MKRKNKKILALMVFFMVAVMFSSTAVTAFAAPKTTSAIGSSVSDLVQSSGTTGLNTVKDFVDPDKIEATSTIKANQTVSLVIEMDGNALVDEYLARQDEFASYRITCPAPAVELPLITSKLSKEQSLTEFPTR